MKKKALLASAVALVTASAMTFAPVSYKVIDKVSAASVDENVVKASATLKVIYDNIKAPGNEKLKTAFEAAVGVVSDNIAGNIDVAQDLPNLASKFNPTQQAAINDAVEGFLTQLVEDFGNLNADFSDVSPELEAAILELNTALGTSITRPDVAAFLKEVKDGILEKIEDDDFLDIDFLEDGALTEAAKDEIKAILNDQWDNSTSSLITSLKGLYTNDKDDLLEDIDTLIENLQGKLSESEKRTVAVGSLALAVAYAQYYFDINPLIAADGNVGKKYYFTVDYDTNLSVLTGFVKWNSTSNGSVFGTAGLEAVSGAEEARVELNLNGKFGSPTVTLSAVLDGSLAGIPNELDGVKLFSVTNVYQLGSDSTGGGDVGVVSPDLSLVSDYQAKAEAIAGKLSDYLTANPVLNNNSLKLELVKQLEDQLRQALLVQAAGAVTVSNGVSTLNLTTAQLENIYNTQLNTVLNAAKEALKAKELDLALAPTLTFNIGVTSNGEVNLSKAIIDSLLSKQIAAVGVKTGDAVVEADLSQLGGTSKVAIKKTASTVTGAKSDAYSIAITDADGKALTGFEKQYRVTLPVNGTSSNVTVAKLADGSQTLIGGQYDPATRTITFYTNELGDFVVVENSAQFNDIAKLAWAKNPIQLLADKGLLLGKGNGVFDPNGNVTRAEFTAMLVRSLNLNASTQVTFNDVSENAWYYDAVSAAKAYGIVNGRSASTFDPNAQISREEMASIIANALKVMLDFEAPANTDELINAFVDGSDVAAVHRANVALLKNEGIIQGKGHDNYDPKGNATRAESAVVIEKIFNLR